jgi:hypothetical protein
MQQILNDKFSYDKFYYSTGVNLSTSLLWQFISSQLANHIKYSDYFDKFSLLSYTDEQNLYFDKLRVRTSKWNLSHKNLS